MAWVRIHDGAMTHPKVVGLSDKAFRLWVWGLSYAQQHLTDGLLTADAIPTRFRRAIDVLVTRKLWETHDVGYKIHDYLTWNDSRELVLSKRGAARERMSNFRKGLAEKNESPNTVDVRENFSKEQTRTFASGTSLYVPCRSGVESGSFPEKGSGEKPDDLADRAGRLLQESYPAWYTKWRNGAKLRLVANSLAFDDALSLVQQWDDARLEKLARVVLTTDDEWIARTDRSFRIFATKASWADDRLRQIESGAR
jgi:hypothetical protein